MMQNKLEYKIVAAFLKYELISKDQAINLNSLLDDAPKERKINVGFALTQPRLVPGHYEEVECRGTYIGFFQHAFYEPVIRQIYIKDKFEDLWINLYDLCYDEVSLTKELTDMVLKTIKEDHVEDVIITGDAEFTEVQIRYKDSGFDLVRRWQNATRKHGENK